MVFEYTIKLVADGKYGSQNLETGEWTGMVGEILNQEADIIVADLTITQKRQKVIDFTSPFMSLGVTILYKKPDFTAPSMLSFLDPFTTEIYLYIVLVYVGVSLLVFVISRFQMTSIKDYSIQSPLYRFSPYEGEKETFSALDSFWFILAALLYQRVAFLPK